MAVDVRKPLKNFVPHLLAARDQKLHEAGGRLIEYPQPYRPGFRNHARNESRTSCAGNIR